MNKLLKRYLVAECICNEMERRIAEIQKACVELFTGSYEKTFQYLNDDELHIFMNAFDDLMITTGLATKYLHQKLELQGARDRLDSFKALIPEEELPSIEKNWWVGSNLYKCDIWKEKELALITQQKLPDLEKSNLCDEEAVKFARLKYAGLEKYMDTLGYSFGQNLSEEDSKWMRKAHFAFQHFHKGQSYRLCKLWEDEKETSKWIVPKTGGTAIRRIAKYGRDGVVSIISYEYKLDVGSDFWGAKYPQYKDYSAWEIDDSVLSDVRIEITRVGQF